MSPIFLGETPAAQADSFSSLPASNSSHLPIKATSSEKPAGARYRTRKPVLPVALIDLNLSPVLTDNGHVNVL